MSPVTLTSAPLLRRGTTIVAAGIEPPDGTVATSSLVPLIGFVLNVCGMITVGSSPLECLVATGTPFWRTSDSP